MDEHFLETNPDDEEDQILMKTFGDKTEGCVYEQTQNCCNFVHYSDTVMVHDLFLSLNVDKKEINLLVVRNVHENRKRMVHYDASDVVADHVEESS